MIDFDLLAYAMLGLSLLVSAAQIGGWMLNADPRTILRAGRWSAATLAAATPLILLWLAVSGRSTLAMMLAVFVLPVFVQGAPRWRGFLVPLGALKFWRRTCPPDGVSPQLAAQCAAVLAAYLEQNGAVRERMSMGEALAVLGLEPGASAYEIREAHRRLEQRLDPKSSGTRYLTLKISEARDVLLAAS
jgi:hypothetical protein